MDLEMSSKRRAKDEQSSESPSLMTELPKDVIVEIIARVPRSHYPTLSFVSKHLGSLVVSPDIDARRSLLGLTEHCLYVILHSDKTSDCRLYTLCRKANGNNSLVLIPSLPVMPRVGSFVAVGSRVYVFGEIDGALRVVDCKTHRVQPLSSIPVPMTHTIANIIDGRIYVIGCYKKRKLVVVFNTETQTWEKPVMIKVDIELGDAWRGCVVMDDKLYARDSVYEPKRTRC
ncbi:unnamed protein product [Thlaspi arvense]|uniref:F-box domain-containing protein n=1 Tax=Thlaspi arvense TaxID=13288 RepID=A0AAU9SCK8_THLAR|nr:unnamed protein product [Thlaspi arvense]